MTGPMSQKSTQYLNLWAKMKNGKESRKRIKLYRDKYGQFFNPFMFIYISPPCMFNVKCYAVVNFGTQLAIIISML